MITLTINIICSGYIYTFITLYQYVHEGDFRDDKRHGRGAHYFFDGTKYVGDWLHDQRTGQGVLTLPDGNQYERRIHDNATLDHRTF